MSKIQGKMIYNGYSYRINSKKLSTVYYKCSECDSKNCKARLTKTEEKIVLRGIHCCNSTLPIAINSEISEITTAKFIENFIDDASSKLELYRNKIFEQLLLKLSENYPNIPYKIPCKKIVYSKIRTNRGAMNLSTIQAVMMPPLRCRANDQPFFRRYWAGDIDGEYHQIIIWCTNESLSLMRYN